MASRRFSCVLLTLVFGKYSLDIFHMSENLWQFRSTKPKKEDTKSQRDSVKATILNLLCCYDDK